MPIVPHLSLLALRPTISGVRADPTASKDAEALAAQLSQRFAAAGGRLSSALQDAALRAWQVLELALGGSQWWEKGQRTFSAADDQTVRDAVRHFLDSPWVSDLAATAAYFRRQAAREVRTARTAGLLDDLPDDQQLARQAVGVWFTAVESAQQAAGEKRILDHLASDLRAFGHSQLARLLEIQGQSGNSLLAAAVRTAFRRILERDEALRQQLPWSTASASPKRRRGRWPG
jgi:hypothetical protein